MTSPDMLRDVIREVVRDVIREVIAEEMAAIAASQAPTGAAQTRRGSGRTSTPTPTSAQRARVSSDVIVERGALTERHVRSVGDATTITIGSKVVITPLARERARTMGIEIIRVSLEG